MQMTDKEIIKTYRESKNKRAQIGILADLNACPKEVIIEILVAAGEMKTPKRKPAKKEEIPRVKRTRVSKTSKPEETQWGGERPEEDGDIFVTKEVSRLLCENVDHLEDSIKSMEKELLELQEALAKRKEEFEQYIIFLKRVRTKGEDK